MATRTRFVVNQAGVAELLRSPGVRADLERRARQVQAAAGPGHEVEIHQSPTRVRASITTVTAEARLAEAQTRNLTRAIDAARR
jgi:hypothetical protein